MEGELIKVGKMENQDSFDMFTDDEGDDQHGRAKTINLIKTQEQILK